MSALPDELADIGAIPPEDNKYFQRSARKPLEQLLHKVAQKKKYELVIHNHQSQMHYHYEKIKEVELKLNIAKSQVAYDKERVKKLLKSVWEDIQEDEELEVQRKK